MQTKTDVKDGHEFEYNGQLGGSRFPSDLSTVSWTCRRCGAVKARGPLSHSTGRPGWWMFWDADGYQSDTLPECTG